MRIITCFTHESLWTGVDAIRDETWDYKEGYGLVASATINGVVEVLRCGVCRWAPDTAVEKALRSVGNPTDPPLRRVWDNPADAEAFRGKEKEGTVEKDKRPVNPTRSEGSKAGHETRRRNAAKALPDAPEGMEEWGRCKVGNMLAVVYWAPLQLIEIPPRDVALFRALVARSTEAQTPKGA